MRTTVTIDDDVLQAARARARAEGRSLGDVLSELARRGLAPQPRPPRSGLPVFDVPSSAPAITPDMVERALDDA